jgi:hypothetical protein
MLRPPVVFRGAVGALTGAGAATASLSIFGDLWSEAVSAIADFQMEGAYLTPATRPAAMAAAPMTRAFGIDLIDLASGTKTAAARAFKASGQALKAAVARPFEASGTGAAAWTAAG